MSPIEIPKPSRDEVKQTSSRLDETSSRLDALSERVVHSEVRVATAITELSGNVNEMTQVLRSSVELRPRLERCEADIAELRERLDRVAPG